MTPDEQRIAIAEACGIVIHDHWGPLYKTPKGIVRVCPDYLGDLNAMHEAEKMLTQAQDYHYRASMLNAVCKDGSGLTAITATAAQRAEAFLRMVGKWEDAK